MSPSGKPKRHELLILRHAKSSWEVRVDQDYERGLAPRGKRDAPRLGRFLAREKLLPDRILCSPARRAADTLRYLYEGAGAEPPRLVWEPRLYSATLDSVLEVLSSVPKKARRLLIVAHNPGLERLVHYLAGGKKLPPTSGKLFPTCALAHFRLQVDWNDLGDGCGRLVRLLRPREMN